MISILTAAALPIAALRDDSRFRNTHIPAIFAVFAAAVFVWQAATVETDAIDRLLYTSRFAAIKNYGEPPTLGTEDPLFSFFMFVVAMIPGTSATTFFVFVAIAICGILTVALRLLLSWWGVALAWHSTLAMGLFLGYASIVLRQGLAMAILFLAIALMTTRARPTHRWLGISLALAAPLFHWSALPFAAICLSLQWLTRHPTLLRFCWLLSAAMFLARNSPVESVASMLPQFMTYTSYDMAVSYAGGTYRLSFLATFALIIVWTTVLRSIIGYRDPLLEHLLTAFLASNIFFLLFGFVAYSDRIAAYSWALVPVLIWRPLQLLSHRPAPVLAVYVAVAFGAAAYTGALITVT